MNATLLANNGYLAKTLWATDTEIVLSDVPTNLGLDATKGGVNIEFEVINYDSVSGSTLQTLAQRGNLVSPEYRGLANHIAGSTVYRTTRGVTKQPYPDTVRESERVDGTDGTIYSIPVSGDVSLINTTTVAGMAFISIGDEQIKYGIYSTNADGTGLRTPLRGYNGSYTSAHSRSVRQL